MDEKLENINEVLSETGPALVACSGGLDSLLLSTLAHRLFPRRTLIVHGTGPAVPAEASVRVQGYAEKEGWRLVFVNAGEFECEDYVRNPVNRCYYCKRRLYETLLRFGYDPQSDRYGIISENGADAETGGLKRYPVLSGANVDDLGEYRPGLDAAREAGVRHPFIEAHIGKDDIRALCRFLKLPFAELAASPCLSSRVYTGTRVEAQWLTLIDSIESRLKRMTGVKVVRCRMKQRNLFIETLREDYDKFPPDLIRDLENEILSKHKEMESLSLDSEPYQPGRAFVHPS
ncbi:MAG: ATPase [Candidatus Omnitrophica bacterium]|nr:ATPase [Candidatus Omnitrophota bacterium]MDD5671131.1 ATPase [Candidatus Omnitrophota bacterium]